MGTVNRPRNTSQAIRLVKTWLPVQLVQELDEAVVASSGAYSGRDDFIREAIADRIAEDRMRPNGDAGPLVGLRPDHKDIRKRSDRANGAITLWGSIGSQHRTLPHLSEETPPPPCDEGQRPL